MLLEIIGALLLAGLVLWLVFEPLRPAGQADLSLLEPEAAEETRRGIALLALKEIEFDRETGKLSDADYELLKTRYGAEALAALTADEGPSAGAPRVDDPEVIIAAQLQSLRSARSSGKPELPTCRNCGPRPEPAAQFCSRCGLPLNAVSFCAECGAGLSDGSRFCATCGSRVAA